MQIYHILPTVPLINNETLLQRVARSMTTWRRTSISRVPTQVLSPELFVSSDEEGAIRPGQILEGEEKKQTHNRIAVVGLIAEPTGTDGQRTTGRTWH